jgi:uncharacterized OsmC-like protein
MTSTVVYQGELRTLATHLRSGQEIFTDAPTDNHGKGEAFSPTDLLATSLACCMITVMGIKAKANEIEIDGAHLEVLKVMGDNPRRVVRIEVTIAMPNIAYSEKDKKILIHTAEHCPVAHSLHPDLEQIIRFKWFEDEQN